jgi:hypothetical protein
MSLRLVVGGGGGGENPRFQIFGRAVRCRKWLSVGASDIVEPALARSIEWYFFLFSESYFFNSFVVLYAFVTILKYFF